LYLLYLTGSTRLICPHASFCDGFTAAGVNLKGHREFETKNRPEGWTTFAISTKAPEPP